MLQINKQDMIKVLESVEYKGKKLVSYLGEERLLEKCSCLVFIDTIIKAIGRENEDGMVSAN